MFFCVGDGVGFDFFVSFDVTIAIGDFFIVVVDIVIGGGGVEVVFNVFVSFSVTIDMVVCDFALAIVVVDLQLLLPLFLL